MPEIPCARLRRQRFFVPEEKMDQMAEYCAISFITSKASITYM
jgi:hypothetical protein